jgi:hypothetical protein
MANASATVAFTTSELCLQTISPSSDWFKVIMKQVDVIVHEISQSTPACEVGLHTGLAFFAGWWGLHALTSNLPFLLEIKGKKEQTM